jgi:hypothetical protein
MRGEQKPSIRLTDWIDVPVLPGHIPNPGIPDHVNNHTEMRLAVFELRGHLGVTNYITIPVIAQRKEHVADA